MLPANNKRLSKRFSARFAGFMALLLLSTSILAASHVHDIDSNYGQSQFEHCAAYHVSDHQQSATNETQTIEAVIGESPYVVEARASSTRRVYLPPSRAPPSFS